MALSTLMSRCTFNKESPVRENERTLNRTQPERWTAACIKDSHLFQSQGNQGSILQWWFISSNSFVALIFFMIFKFMAPGALQYLNWLCLFLAHGVPQGLC